MLGPDGKPLAARGWYDAESLAEDNGTLYVGIERVEKIVRFDYARDGLGARGEPIKVPDDFKTFTYNKSLECLAVPPQGLAARRHADRGHRAQPRRARQSPLLSARRRPGRALFGQAQRRFRRQRLRHPAAGRSAAARAQLFAGARRRHAHPPHPARPHQAGRAGRRHAADRGRSRPTRSTTWKASRVHRNAAGETILTLVSDDNFSVLQRNLLLQFALVGE